MARPNNTYKTKRMNTHRQESHHFNGNQSKFISFDGKFESYKSSNKIPENAYKLESNLYIGAASVSTPETQFFIGTFAEGEKLRFVDLSSHHKSSGVADPSKIYCYGDAISMNAVRWELCSHGSLPNQTKRNKKPCPIILEGYNKRSIYLGRMRINSKYEYGTVMSEAGRYICYLHENKATLNGANKDFEVLCRATIK